MNEKTDLFEIIPVHKAVISLVVPTVISQLITVAYNMADTFFIGQIGDPDQVAAVSLCMPLFILLTGMANLFGIGGSSLISRSLGVGNTERARKVSAFSIWTAGTVSMAYGLLVFALRKYILPAVGANEATYDFCSQYIFWAIAVGAVPTVLNAAFAHLVQAEGYSKQASFGMAMGGVLNMILDPIFISLLGFEVAGAAIATMLSNLIATMYFVVLIYRKQDSTVLTLDPRFYTWESRMTFEVLLVGLPSCVMNLMGVCSNIMMNRLMVSYCNEAVAGIGIAKKVDMLAFAIATGMSQGVLPLIGYNYSSKNYKRMLSAIKTTFVYSLTIALLGMIFLLTCAGPIVSAFIDDLLTVEYGGCFQRIICITGPCTSVTMIVITFFQSVGKKVQPLLLSLLRKGGFDIPAMLLMNAWLGVNGIAWATPIADFTAMLVAISLFIPFWKKLKLELNQKNK
ncbi:MAG: MATE family efflux transporter [Oscillospiraceae bacterium]|nr:MATE family efflux transporter [Oscillospiraceae bacterium]